MDQPTGQPVQGTEVAIIGMAGRFPGAPTLEAYWHNLVNGVEGIERFGNGSGAVSPHTRDLEVRAASRLQDIDLFDAEFFGFSPKEAELIDPQHRLFLECAHEALERAGYDPERYGGLIGVYAGMGANTYLRHVLEVVDQNDAALGLQLVIGNDKDYLTTMVSYKLNLRGPSVAVQTACSTSLVAVHLACQALLDYECDLALAGGVSVRAPQPSTYRYYEGGILSPDGYCRAFDARAQGTVFGNGLGVVVLRRLEDALTDGDRIVAVIRGSAVNNDGAAKVGYTAPAVRGQVEMIGTALARAGVDPASIQYVEAHGTGTPLGDPIEIKALTEAYRAKTAAIGYCGLGSVKTNIGHLDAAAGVAGLIKTALALWNRTIPPTLNFSEPNPQASLGDSPFYVVTEAQPWDGPRPRRAAVSSLGIGGTNAHVILEEAPPAPPCAAARPWEVITLSGKTPSALESTTEQLATFLEQEPGVGLADVAYTCQVGRREFPHRRAFVLPHTASDQGCTLRTARVWNGLAPPGGPSIVFMFPGQGVQFPGTARELFEREPAFRERFAECADILQPDLGVDLRDLLFRCDESDESAVQRLRQTLYAQPAIFALTYALAHLWMRWGIAPDAMIGHSGGEYVAACLAGVFELADALRVVRVRAELMHAQPPGKMLVVHLPEKSARAYTNDQVTLAAVNAPTLCVLSGPPRMIEDYALLLEKQMVSTSLLHIPQAAHSPMMAAVQAPFRSLLERTPMKTPRIPYVSNVTGTWIRPQEATDPTYWIRHLMETVRFRQGAETLMSLANPVFLEMAPGTTLSALIGQQATLLAPPVTVTSLPGPGTGGGDQRCVLEGLAKLWSAGARVDWTQFHAGRRRQRVSVPTYPFERRRFWIGPAEGRSSARAVRRERSSIDEWFHVPVWKQSVPSGALPRRIVAESGGGWLVLSDSTGLGSRLARRLQTRGERVVNVAADGGFARLGDEAFTIDPGCQGDYDLLFRALGANHAFHTIVHLWNVTGDTSQRGCGTPVASAFEQLLFLAQAAHANGVANFHLAVCANGLARVIPGDVVCPEKALAIGACRVMPQEYAGVTSRWIDLTLPKASRKLERLADLLVDELECESWAQGVAYRSRQRWVQGFDQMALRADAPPRLRDGGAYLITGGLGGLGLILARHLATTFHARLVLTGRTALPAREAWAERLATHPEADQEAAAIRAITELEAAGAEILTISANVCDTADVERTFRDACQRFGHIDGVFHLAGVPGAGLMQLKTPDMAVAVCAPKVRGTACLVSACRGRGLDFVALFSSLAGVTGGVGQSDYCAASAFMDAVADASSEERDPAVVAIDWDAWQSDRWQDAALGQRPDIREQARRWRSQFGIRPAEGMEVLSRVLSARVSRMIVSTHDLRLAMDAHDRVLDGVARTGPNRDRAGQRPHGVAYVAPTSSTETLVAAVWQDVLGVSAVGTQDNFFALGGHSLLMLQIVARLRQEFGMDVPVRALFEQPTVAALAGFIDQRRTVRPPPASFADSELVSVLEEVERMTPEQVLAQLADLGPASSPRDRP